MRRIAGSVLGICTGGRGLVPVCQMRGDICRSTRGSWPNDTCFDEPVCCAGAAVPGETNAGWGASTAGGTGGAVAALGLGGLATHGISAPRRASVAWPNICFSAYTSLM